MDVQLANTYHQLTATTVQLDVLLAHLILLVGLAFRVILIQELCVLCACPSVRPALWELLAARVTLPKA